MAGLYVHIPFCHSKCAYCDFYSTPRKFDSALYVDALIRELHARRDEIAEPFRTIYIGGGTPSILPVGQLERLFASLPTAQAEEITVEVNPEDVTAELTDALRRCGVNRVSMGVQSLVDAELAFIGRRHKAADAIAAAKRLLDAGLTNINLDIIFGLPGQTIMSMEDSLGGILELGPTHLSAYCLMYEDGTRLTAMLRAGKIAESPHEMLADMYGRICRTTAAEGFAHYEISNFAKPGFHSRHNSAYWDMTPYLGLGVSAHSFDGTTRRYNPNEIDRYVNASEPIFIIDEETADQQHNDLVMTSLRTAKGLNYTDYEARFGAERLGCIKRIAAPYITRGEMQSTDSGIRIAEASWLISDNIIVDFFLD